MTDATVTPIRRRDRSNRRPTVDITVPAEARRLRELAAAWADQHDVSALLTEAEAIEAAGNTDQLAA